MVPMMAANSTQFTVGPTNMTVADFSGSSGGYVGDSSGRVVAAAALAKLS